MTFVIQVSCLFLSLLPHSDQEVAIVTIDGSSLDVDLANVDSALHIFNLDNGLDQYHSLKSLTSDLKVKKSDSYVSSSSLSVIHHRARLIGKERLAVYTPAPHPGCGWGDEFYGISLVDAFQQVGLDAELVYRKDWKNAAGQFSDIVHLRGIVKISPVSTARNYMWLISHPDDVGEDELSACDSVFVASEPFSKRLTIEQNRVIDFLPQCSSFHPLDPRENIYADDLRPFAVFVGDSKKVLRYPIDELVKKWSRLFLFGPNWNGVERLGSRYFPGVLANQLLPQIYSSFGAVLNQHWGDMARSGFVSNRLYDIAACGGRFITDWCDGIPADLAKFGDVWMGDDFDELFERQSPISLIDRYEQSLAFYSDNSFLSRARTIIEKIYS